MFETMCIELPTGVAQVLEKVKLAENHQSVEWNPKPSLLSVKTKRLIDENYLSYPSISRIARRLGVTHEHLQMGVGSSGVDAVARGRAHRGERRGGRALGATGGCGCGGRSGDRAGQEGRRENAGLCRGCETGLRGKLRVEG